METPRRTWRERLDGLKEEATDAHHKAMDSIWVSLVSIGAIAAYIFQPIEKFANYNTLFISVEVLIFVLIAALAFKVKRGPVIQMYGIITLLTVIVSILLIQGLVAASKSDWHDRRCLRIQNAMLRPTSNTRDDLADVFTAMQCRPQGGAPEPIYVYRKGDIPDAQKIEAQQAYQERALANEVHLNKPADLPVPVVPAKASLRGSAKPSQR